MCNSSLLVLNNLVKNHTQAAHSSLRHQKPSGQYVASRPVLSGCVKGELSSKKVDYRFYEFLGEKLTSLTPFSQTLILIEKFGPQLEANFVP